MPDWKATIVHQTRKLSLPDCLTGNAYYLSFSLFLASRLIEILAIDSLLVVGTNAVASVLQVAALALILPLCVERITRLEPRSAALVCLVFVPLLISATVSHSYYLIWDFLYIMAAHDVSIRRMAKISLVTTLVALGVAVLISQLGLTDTHQFVRWGEARQSWGFTHPNSFGKTLLSVGMAWMVVRFDKLGWRDGILLVVLAAAVLVLSGSRTTAVGFVIILVAWAVASLLNGKPKLRETVSRWAIVGVGAFTLASVALPAFYSADNAVLAPLNHVLSGRISFPAVLYANGQLGLLGFDLSQSSDFAAAVGVSDGALPIDNTYCNLLIQYGPVVLLLAVFLYGRAVYRSFELDETLVCGVGLLSCAVLGLAETYAIDVSFNYFLVCLGTLLRERGMDDLSKCGDSSGGGSLEGNERDKQKISIIVPVFNTEAATLNRCVESILRQTHGDYELIIVDDGSEDESCRRALEDILRLDRRVFVLKVKHGGVSKARNAGLERASGEWVAFIDSDDMVAPTFLEEALSAATSYGADFVAGSLLRVTNHSLTCQASGPTSVHRITSSSIDRYRESMLSGCRIRGGTSVWPRVQGPISKLYRRALIRDLRFVDRLSMGEDVYFNYQYLARCGSAIQSDRIWCHYLRHGASLTHSRNFDSWRSNMNEFLALAVDEGHELARRSRVARIATDALVSFIGSRDCDGAQTMREMLEVAKSERCFGRAVRRRYDYPPHRTILYWAIDHGLWSLSRLICRAISLRS